MQSLDERSTDALIPGSRAFTELGVDETGATNPLFIQLLRLAHEQDSQSYVLVA